MGNRSNHIRHVINGMLVGVLERIHRHFSRASYQWITTVHSAQDAQDDNTIPVTICDHVTASDVTINYTAYVTTDTKPRYSVLCALTVKPTKNTGARLFTATACASSAAMRYMDCMPAAALISICRSSSSSRSTALSQHRLMLVCSHH